MVDRNGTRAKFCRLFSERRRQLLFCSNTLFVRRLLLPTRENNSGSTRSETCSSWARWMWTVVECSNVGTLPWMKWLTSWSPCIDLAWSSSHACPRSRRETDWICFCMIVQHQEREESKESWTDEQITEKTQLLNPNAPGQDDGSSPAMKPTKRSKPTNNLQNRFCQQAATKRPQLYSNPAWWKFHFKNYNLRGAVANRLRRRTSDQTVLGSNPVRIRPRPLRWVLGQGSSLPLSQEEAFTLASISYLAILVKYILAKKKKKIS